MGALEQQVGWLPMPLPRRPPDLEVSEEEDLSPWELLSPRRLLSLQFNLSCPRLQKPPPQFNCKNSRLERPCPSDWQGAERAHGLVAVDRQQRPGGGEEAGRGDQACGGSEKGQRAAAEVAVGMK